MTSDAILIVEDDAAIRNLLGIAFRQFGLSVQLAEDGQKAIEIYLREPARVVLMDVQMPGLDGPQTFVALKAINPNVVCCFLSAYSGKYCTDDLLALGAAAVMEKPCRLEELRDTILRLLGRTAASVAASASAPVEKNRRSDPRQAAHPDVTVSYGADQITQNLARAALDISARGIRLLTTAPLGVGQEVSIRLDRPSPICSITRKGKVVWAAQRTEHHHEVGVQLEEQMEPAELYALT